MAIPNAEQALARKRAHILLLPSEFHSHFNPFMQILYAFGPLDVTVTLYTTEERIAMVRKLQSKGDFGNLDLRTVALMPVPVEVSGEGDDPNQAPVRQVTKKMELEFQPHRASLVAEEDVSSRPTCMIVDCLIFWAEKFANEMSIPKYLYYPTGCWPAYLQMRNEVEGLDNGHVDIPGIPGVLASEPPWSIFDMVNLGTIAGVLVNTFEEFESNLTEGMEYYLKQHAAINQYQKAGKYFPIGYLNPPPTSPISPPSSNGNGINTNGSTVPPRNSVLQWLDEQQVFPSAGPGSVLYIAFGTVSEVSNELIYELARGLDMCATPFVWALRPTTPVDDVSILLPPGFLSRNQGRGVVTMGMVPQIDILNHPAVGGFMSHCGWNSTIESVFAGVPILAWPINGDQPVNARFIVETTKVGLHVTTRPFTHDRVVAGEVVAKAVKSLMVDEKGKEIKANVAKWKGIARASSEKGGSSWRQFARFIDEISFNN